MVFPNMPKIARFVWYGARTPKVYSPIFARTFRLACLAGFEVLLAELFVLSNFRKHQANMIPSETYLALA
jgi:hypothetical protein